MAENSVMAQDNINIPVPGPSKRSKSYTDLHHLTPSIIVIGAGIAGSALAYSLSASGHSVLLLERDLSEPDRIVGELLQPGGVSALKQLGLERCLDGIDACPVEGYCVVNGEKMVGVPYPALEAMAKLGNDDSGRASNGNGIGHVTGEKSALYAPWPVQTSSGKKEGRAFHHGRLISSLRRACLETAHENLTVLEATVRDLVFCEHTNRVIGVQAAFKIPSPSSSSSPSHSSSSPSSSSDPSTTTPPTTTTTTVVRNVYAPLTIIADGCFSKFRSLPNARLPTPKTKSHFVGVVLKDVDLPINHCGTVCLTPNGPVLLYQIAEEAREIRMLVDIKGKLPSVADGSLKQHILTNYLPHLPPSLRPAVELALSSQRLRTMPNSFLPPSPQTNLQGCILVGDAWNMRHPLTGGGMTVAFNDAVLLTRLLPREKEVLEDWGVVGEKVAEWYWKRKNLAGTINVLSMALYDLFGGADEPDFEILREGCFRYFELGGNAVAGPVGLLSALTPKPLILFYHFFLVAFYSIYILLTHGAPPQPGEKRGKPSLAEMPGLMVLSGKVFWTACVVLLPYIWTEFKF